MNWLVSCGLTLATAWPSGIRQWESTIEKSASTYGVDANLIAAVMFVESHGRPEALSEMGAVGPMQIMPFPWRPVERLADPHFNIEYGTRILEDILRQTDGDLRRALGAYNCGFKALDAGHCGRGAGHDFAERVFAVRAQFNECWLRERHAGPN